MQNLSTSQSNSSIFDTSKIPFNQNKKNKKSKWRTPDLKSYLPCFKNQDKKTKSKETNHRTNKKNNVKPKSKEHLLYLKSKKIKDKNSIPTTTPKFKKSAEMARIQGISSPKLVDTSLNLEDTKLKTIKRKTPPSPPSQPSPLSQPFAPSSYWQTIPSSYEVQPITLWNTSIESNNNRTFLNSSDTQKSFSDTRSGTRRIPARNFQTFVNPPSTICGATSLSNKNQARVSSATPKVSSTFHPTSTSTPFKSPTTFGIAPISPVVPSSNQRSSKSSRTHGRHNLPTDHFNSYIFTEQTSCGFEPIHPEYNVSPNYNSLNRQSTHQDSSNQHSDHHNVSLPINTRQSTLRSSSKKSTDQYNISFPAAVPQYNLRSSSKRLSKQHNTSLPTSAQCPNLEQSVNQHIGTFPISDRQSALRSRSKMKCKPVDIPLPPNTRLSTQRASLKQSDTPYSINPQRSSSRQTRHQHNYSLPSSTSQGRETTSKQRGRRSRVDSAGPANIRHFNYRDQDKSYGRLMSQYGRKMENEKRKKEEQEEGFDNKKDACTMN